MELTEVEMAEKLRAAGWFVKRLEQSGEVQGYGQCYATNYLGETYRVVAWQDGKPMLDGGPNGKVFQGAMLGYAFTFGPK